MVEEARLESVYTPKAYPGFESPSLRRNESANVKDTLAKVAEIYQKSLEYVAQVTSENALKVFGFRK